MSEPTATTGYTYFNLTTPHPFVTHVEIHRPSKLNTFTEPMWQEYREIFKKLARSPHVRSIVLSGSGRSFSAGIDVGELARGLSVGEAKDKAGVAGGGDPARVARTLMWQIAEFQDCISSAEDCEKPVICVLHGHCLGLAIDIACATDIRICASDSTFSVKEVDMGLAADVGTLSRLPKITSSQSWVKDVCLSARSFYPDEALRVGFVSEVRDSKDSALRRGIEIACVLAEKSPVAVQGTKALINYSAGRSVSDGLRFTQVWNSAALQTSDLPVSMTAATQKRTPRFEKL